MSEVASYARVSMGGGVANVHKVTGRGINTIRREKIAEYPRECEECGQVHREIIYRYSLDKRFKPENIERKNIPPTNYYIPLYE